MLRFILDLVTAVRVFFTSRTDLALEILALRQQVAVLKRKRPRTKLSRMDRLFWTALRNVWSRWAEVLLIVKPETVVSWHRAGFRLYWRWRSRGPAPGRARIAAEIQDLIRTMAQRIRLGARPKSTASYSNSASCFRDDPCLDTCAGSSGAEILCKNGCEKGPFEELSQLNRATSTY